ncbi:proliferating cell nuclear antigen [Tritrichomonas foetus]|uniref:DNA sliding clamp PCNA n=1 Tax=Tritrichomonas foetus TaxID=1144522 RepID=A0A1J4KI81_9EUKA|nr:proliferating cell nuclear antigen [Tritrichomonas foetus]|eukprot:OHT09382.1 proliferating cell nuclear antigen [Tritrichomonas foetus]
MEARLENPSLFKKTLDALRELVEEANIDCNETGLSLQAMDASHVALVSMHLNHKYFDQFKCSQTTTLGVNLGAIQKILKCGDSQDVLTLRTNEENTELKFQFENGGRYFEFSMNLMDIESEHLAIPDSEPEASVTLPSSEFQKICRDLTQFGDTVKISVKPKTVTFSLSGNTGNGAVTLSSFDSASDDNAVEIKCDTDGEPLELSFALRYLNFFTKAAPLSEKVTLELSNNRPLLVMFQLDDDAGYIKYHLAPKVDDEDGDGEE